MLRQLGVKSKIAMVHVFVCDIGDDDDENFQVERDLALDISALDCSAPQVHSSSFETFQSFQIL